MSEKAKGNNGKQDGYEGRCEGRLGPGRVVEKIVNPSDRSLNGLCPLLYFCPYSEAYVLS